MPKLFKLGAFSIFFWSNEGEEPIHVHVCVGNPYAGATKIWLTRGGGCIIAHNKSRISQNDINELLEIIQANHDFICNKWEHYFNKEIKFYC
ncbi:MAG: DUF4160 domain-containing protein [Oscillospiraceae bacterium]|nr:DUF4160 domain-containing protein [Oscillospiraceae bacterium]